MEVSQVEQIRQTPAGINLLLRVGSVKRDRCGRTLSTSLSRAEKRGTFSGGTSDLSREPGLLNTLGMTFFNELQVTYKEQIEPKGI